MTGVQTCALPIFSLSLSLSLTLSGDDGAPLAVVCAFDLSHDCCLLLVVHPGSLARGPEALLELCFHPGQLPL